MAEELALKPWRDPESIPNQKGFKLIAWMLPPMPGQDGVEVECVVDWKPAPEGHYLRRADGEGVVNPAFVKGWLPVNDPWGDHEKRLQNCGQHIHGLMQRVEALEARAVTLLKIYESSRIRTTGYVMTRTDWEDILALGPTTTTPPAPTTAGVRERIEAAERYRWPLPGGDELRPDAKATADALREVALPLAEERDAERARADAAEAEVARLNAANDMLAHTCQSSALDATDELRVWAALTEAAGLPATATPAEVVARVGEMRSVLYLIDTWRHTYGAALKPTAGSADTFGDGMRKAKAEISGILARLASEAGR